MSFLGLYRVGLLTKILFSQDRISENCLGVFDHLMGFALKGLRRLAHLSYNAAFLLTLFRMGFSGAAHGWEGPPLPKICHTCPTMMKLGTVIPYLKKIQKIYESRDIPREFC